MHIKYHVVATMGLWAINPQFESGHAVWLLMMMLFSGVFIDFFDHGIYSLATVRPFSLERALEEHKKWYEKMETKFYVFHTFEFFILLGLLTHGFWWGTYFMLSYLLHLGLDAYKYISKKRDFGFLRYWLATNWILNEYRKIKA